MVKIGSLFGRRGIEGLSESCFEGGGGEGQKVRQSHTESLFLKLRIRGQTARSTDPFVKMSVSLRRNGKFAAESDPPGRFLNDPNEEIDPGGLEGVKGLKVLKSPCPPPF